MKIRPNENFRLLGTDIRLCNTETYDASWATNQPEWRAKRKIFVEVPRADVSDYPSIMLEDGDYVVTQADPPLDTLKVTRLLRKWMAAVDIPKHTNPAPVDYDDDEVDNERGLLTLTDDAMRALLVETSHIITNLKENDRRA